ncbi:MAG: nitrogenase component 1 [Oscillospiraceae bacterium]|nr:nitrogenase component 1 [Oscillospiraceae bacterium]
MDPFYEYERDRVFMGLHNAAVNHQQGVNGKVSGNLEAFAQIRDAVLILHGPKGCAYHYRYYARRRWLPAYALESDDLTEAEVVAGGEEKLLALTLRLIRERKPGCAVLIPTVASDVMQCDLPGVARTAAQLTGCPVLAVRSEVFSHIDKTVMRRSRREGLKSWGSAEPSRNTDSKGCGFSEAMLTLAEQLMEPRETEPGTVNVEGYSWGYGGRLLLRGMDGMLREMGLRLRACLPACTAREIAEAPAAQLNVARRVRWAAALQKRYGIPYLHVHGFARYVGLEGILRFYRDVAEKLELHADVDRIFEARMRPARERFEACSRAYEGKRVLLLPRSFSAIPNQLVQAVKGAGIPVTDVVARISPEALRQSDLDGEMVEDILANIRRAMELCGVPGELVVDPDKAQLRELTEGADLMIANPETQLLCPGKPILSDDLLFVAPLDPENMCRNAEYLASGLNKLPTGNRLLLNRVRYAPGLYPQTDNEGDALARELWRKLWQNRGEGT